MALFSSAVVSAVTTSGLLFFGFEQPRHSRLWREMGVCVVRVLGGSLSKGLVLQIEHNVARSLWWCTVGYSYDLSGYIRDTDECSDGANRSRERNQPWQMYTSTSLDRRTGRVRLWKTSMRP